MAQPLNLLARDDFNRGDRGYVLGDGVKLGDGVRKLTDAGVPHGAICVTALEDVKAWTNGHFDEVIRTRVGVSGSCGNCSPRATTVPGQDPEGVMRVPEILITLFPEILITSLPESLTG